MCGRYALTSPREALASLIGAEPAPDYAPRYNISPGQTIQAVFGETGARRVERARFGFAPLFSGDDRGAPLVCSARAETASRRPTFSSALRERRCLVPADAWYEWKTIGRFRQPYMMRRRDGAPMMFAGLWETVYLAGGASLSTVVLLTTAAAEDVAPIHERMPAVIDPSHWEAWLDRRVDGASLAMRCLEPAPEGTFETQAISALVNHPGNDGPEIQAPASDRPRSERSAPRPV